MRKKDPRYEITEDLKEVLRDAVLDPESGKTKPKKTNSGSLPLSNLKEVLYSKYGGTAINMKTPKEQLTDASILEILGFSINDMVALIPDYYHAIDRGNARKLKEVLDKGFPVNYFNPVSGETALHSLAAGGARPAIRVLLTYENIDFLARDNQGRLSSEMAYLYGRDPALARLLGNKEVKQARAQGIKLTRRPAPKPEP
jgi:ankyrin repeat protein